MHRVDRFVFLVAFVWAMFLPYKGIAQTKAVIRVTLIDAATSEKVGFATVSAVNGKTGKAEGYALSDADGNASISLVSSGSYTLKAELLGYEPVAREIVLGRVMHVSDTLYMKPSSESLDAATVSAAGNDMVIKKDTIEYNTGSYLTTDNDLLEDLLKKLPGVEVDDNGKVTVNGESVSRITIGGKTFLMTLNLLQGISRRNMSRR